MPAAITIVCPSCKKAMQAPDSVQGKKIKCKACATVFAAVAEQASAKSELKAEEAGPKKHTDDEEWGEIKAYGMTIAKEKPRCPHCAWEMESDEVLCLHCGYNLMTRERLVQRVLEPHTGGDYFLWWLAPVVCMLLALSAIGGVVAIWLWLNFELGYPWDTAVNVYFSVMGAAIAWFAGKFAFKRMVFHPHPPEREMQMEIAVEQEGDLKVVRRSPDDDDDDEDEEDEDDEEDDEDN